MKILFLAHRLPYPPRTGDRVRAFHVARHLSQRHRVTLACSLEGRGELKAAQELSALIPDLEVASAGKLGRYASAMLGVAGSRPLSVRYFACRALARQVVRRLSEDAFDVIYVSSSSVAQYSMASPVRSLIDFVDVDSDKWAQYAANTSGPMSWLYRLESRRLRRYESEIARHARVSIFATAEDRSLFRQFAPDVESAVVPNGVDLQYFRPFARPLDAAPTMIFTGALDYFPNVDGIRWFAEEILPLVRQRIPEIRFLVVGRRPNRSVLRIGRLPGVTVLGDVPDVRPHMRDADLAVVPIRIARGIQNKALEAMAMGLPVIATAKAASGIEATAPDEWLVENDPSAFAERIVALFDDPAARVDLGLRARAFVERKHSWRKILGDFESLIAKAAA